MHQRTEESMKNSGWTNVCSEPHFSILIDTFFTSDDSVS